MVYHVLNGDALKQQFPSQLEGEQIVARECLVDGPVQGESLEAFYKTRAHYLNATYGGGTDTKYEDDVIPELNKLQDLQPHSKVYLWFEDDLFCQVNFWFVYHQLMMSNTALDLYLIRPFSESLYGFGGMSSEDLSQAFLEPIPLTNCPKLVELWPAYQDNRLEDLKNIGEVYKQGFPFLMDSIQAHIDRNLSNSHPGRPETSLKQIIEELNNPGFGPVFQEFCKREAIYGFGDLQVKRLYDSVISL